MTTILGIEAKEGIVLASDTQIRYLDGNLSSGSRKSVGNKKLFSHDNAAYIYGFSGTYTEYILELNTSLQKMDSGFVLEALAQGYFSDLCSANLEGAVGDGKKIDTSQQTDMLIATKDSFLESDVTLSQPALYYVYPMGFVRKLPRHCIGSGSDFVLPYLEENLNYLGALELPSLDLAISVAYNALRLATSQDLGSSGHTFAIVTSEDIFDYFEYMQTSQKLAENDFLERVLQQFSK